MGGLKLEGFFLYVPESMLPFESETWGNTTLGKSIWVVNGFWDSTPVPNVTGSLLRSFMVTMLTWETVVEAKLLLPALIINSVTNSRAERGEMLYSEMLLS